jgi:hypothetical protein
MGSKARNAMDLTSSKESKHSGIRSYSFTRMLKKTLPSIIDIFKNKERRQNRRSRTLRVNHEAAIVQSSTALAQ